MNKLFAKVGILGLLMCVSLYGWTAGPCKVIAISCMQNGYYKGGHGSGKELVDDCVIPVATGEKRLPNTNFSPEQLQKCKVKLTGKIEKLKSKLKQKVLQ